MKYKSIFKFKYREIEIQNIEIFSFQLLKKNNYNIFMTYSFITC